MRVQKQERAGKEERVGGSGHVARRATRASGRRRTGAPRAAGARSNLSVIYSCGKPNDGGRGSGDWTWSAPVVVDPSSSSYSSLLPRGDGRLRHRRARGRHRYGTSGGTAFRRGRNAPIRRDSSDPSKHPQFARVEPRFSTLSRNGLKS